LDEERASFDPSRRTRSEPSTAKAFSGWIPARIAANASVCGPLEKAAHPFSTSAHHGSGSWLMDDNADWMQMSTFFADTCGHLRTHADQNADHADRRGQKTSHL
jgi:hypothetical protein